MFIPQIIKNGNYITNLRENMHDANYKNNIINIIKGHSAS